jgi:exopolysaccharide biosynthesis polyprenyl glycosylphosphotransferase
MHNTISDIVVLPAPTLRPAAAAHRNSALIPRAALLASLDSLAALAALAGVLISLNLPHMSGSLDDFLSIRVTVKNVLLLIFLSTAWPLLFRGFGLYSVRKVQSLRSEFGRLAAAVTVGTGLACVFPLTSVSGTMKLDHLPYFWAASLTGCVLVRAGRRFAVRAGHRRVRRTLIVGTGPLAQRAYRELRADGFVSHEVVGFVDHPDHDGTTSALVEERTIGTLDHLEQILMRHVIDEVIIALPVKSCYQHIQRAIRLCEHAGVQSRYGADLFESTVAFPRYDAYGDRAFVAMQVTPDSHRLLIKRVIDVIGATAGLILLSPVMLVVAIAVKATSRGPIVYAQDRCGLNKRPFRMYKFRSMVAEAEQLQSALEVRNEAHGPVFKILHDPRMTRFGRMLRKTSLDELPQLWNVLRGDMSLVGPRPLPYRDVDRIARPSDMRRFSMRPGLTCLWQVQGRCTIGFERWVELDLEYIDNWSLALDARILVQTVPAVLGGVGAV